MSEGQLYRLEIIATGEVRDADGNLVSQPEATTTIEVTEQEALAIAERNRQQ